MPRSPGRDHACQRVQIGAVAIDQTAAAVDQIDDVADMLVEQAERVGIGKHHAGHRVVAGRTEGGDVDITAFVRRQFENVEAGHTGRGRIGAVG